MKIKIEQSGGFAGISSTNEIDADKLPSSLEGTVRGLLDTKKLPLTKGLKQPKGAADHLNYKITIRNKKQDHVIEFNEFDMDSSLKSLIKYIQNNSEKSRKYV